MKIDKLSLRLRRIASYIPNGAKVADIGSDHAYLPCYAVKKGKASYAVAGEVAIGPYESAKKQVKTEGLEADIDVRLGDGLRVIAKNEVDCIVIAGMGGALITSILTAGKEKLENVKRLILQPNIGAIHIRKWLVHNGWELVAEEILEEYDKIYEILVAEKRKESQPHELKEVELLIGPFLLKEKNEVLMKKWTSELQKWKRILDNMEKAVETTELKKRKEQLIHQISLVEEALK